jgi:hypothetical protein
MAGGLLGLLLASAPVGAFAQFGPVTLLFGDTDTSAVQNSPPFTRVFSVSRYTLVTELEA